METIVKIPKAVLIQKLRERDGTNCTHPECGLPLDFDLPETSKHLVTIDHKYPQSKCKEDNWEYADIWDLDNLQLMHKSCNARKGSKIYLPDGTLPPSKRKMMLRREKRASRTEIAECCNSGRMLEYDQICSVCGSEAKPVGFPASAQVTPNDCPHEYPFSCYACIVGLAPRQAAIVTVLDGTVLEDDRIIGSAYDATE